MNKKLWKLSYDKLKKLLEEEKRDIKDFTKEEIFQAGFNAALSYVLAFTEEHID